MKIKLKHAILHDGKRLEAGGVKDLAEAAAMALIASGAAVAVEDVKLDANADPKPGPKAVDGGAADDKKTAKDGK